MARGSHTLGRVLLGAWLVAHGAQAFVAIHVPGLPLLLGGLAIVAGLLVMTGR